MSKSKSSKKNKDSTHVIHPFAPVYSSTSKILILGTIPSPSSRKNEFYYMHPQNRFWLVMQKIFDVEFKFKNNEGPKAINERKQFLLNHDIAMWDVIKSCDIIGAGDSSIKNAKENDFHEIFKNCNIEKVFCTGSTAFKYWKILCKDKYKVKAYYLPSTSPANQKYWNNEKLIKKKKKNILSVLNKK